MRNTLTGIKLFMVMLLLTTSAQALPVDLKNGWAADLTYTIAALKVVESNRENTPVDVVPNLGGGVALTIFYANAQIGNYDMLISFNAPEIILTPRFDDETGVDLTIGGDVGFLNNRLRLGVGYELGTQPYERSRWIGLISIGVN